MADPRVARSAPLAVLALLVLLLPAAALGQDADAPAGSHPEVIVEQVTADLTAPPDLRLLVEVANSTNPAPGTGAPDSCSGQHIENDPAAGRFRFEESTVESGCSDALLDIPVPPGATVLEMNFTATRIVTDPSGSGGVPPSMPQYFMLSDSGFTRRFDYFDDTAGSTTQPRAFSDRYLMPEGLAGVRLLWHFEDRGNLAFGPLPYSPSTAGLSAEVSRINLTWPQVPLHFVRAPPGPERVDEANRTGMVEQVLEVTLPEAFVGPGPSGEPPVTAVLRIAVAEGPTLVEVVGPRGVLDPDAYFIVEGNQRTLVFVPAGTVDAQGPGVYRVHYETVRALPPPPAQGDPSYIYPFYYILALLPLVAAVLALHQASLYVRQAEGTYKRTAWPVFVAVALVVAYYVLLLLYSFLASGPTRMATLPLDREPLLIYVQFVLLLLMLAGSALAVSRTLIGTMRRDLEDRRRKEEQLRRSNEELERFAYVASHDLQEPLRKVAGFTALLQRRYEGRLDRDADEIIQYAVDGATRMQTLIKDILAYSRVGSKELNRVPVDANATMQLVASDLGEQIKDTRAEVTWGDLPTVRVDASQLRQVLQNLVENAIKYRHPKRRPKVEVSAAADGSGWRFTVSDNGEGIPEDKHEEIFGLFRRLHGQDQPGTGIGLAVAKKAVERHDGRIWVESTPGKGSRFHFTVPRGPLEDGPQRASRPQDAGVAASA